MQDKADENEGSLPLQPEAARAFLQRLRQEQQIRRIALGGVLGLSSEQRAAIAAAFDEPFIRSATQAVGEKPITILLERFEELSRRHKQLPNTTLRSSIQKLLVAELSANAQSFRSFRLMPKDLVSVTLYHGDVTDIARQPDWKDLSREAVRQAFIHKPADPIGFLTRLKNDVSSLAADNEFAQFRHSPSVFYYAAANSPSDPHGFLRKVKEQIATLSRDPDLERFRDTPHMFWIAATRAPKNPRAFLQRRKEPSISLGLNNRLDGNDGPTRS